MEPLLTQVSSFAIITILIITIITIIVTIIYAIITIIIIIILTQHSPNCHCYQADST